MKSERSSARRRAPPTPPKLGVLTCPSRARRNELHTLPYTQLSDAVTERELEEAAALKTQVAAEKRQRREIRKAERRAELKERFRGTRAQRWAFIAAAVGLVIFLVVFFVSRTGHGRGSRV